MRIRSVTAFPALLAAVFPGGSALAQTDKPPEAAGFETQGETTAGYRFSDVGGRREKFQELFNLRGGPRLLDFHLGGSDSTGKNRFADNYQLTASGLGGDPFPGGQFVISKARLYDFRASFRQTYYYWDRNDSAVLPSGFRGLTTNHNWATVRRFGSANLLAHASNRLKFRFEYGRSSRNGVNYTTRVMDYFGSPAAWGAFLRDSPYYVEAPLQESTDRVSGGFNYTAGSWSFQYTAGYQQFEQDLGWRNVASPQVSINLDSAASRREPLVAARWSEFRSLKTPLSEFFYNGRVNSRLSLRGDFIFFRYRGPATLDAAFTGVARTTGTAVGSYDISLNSQARLTEPNYIVDQGFTLKLAEWSNFHADYRYNRFTEHNRATVRSVRDSTAFDEAIDHEWREGLHQLDLNLEFVPTPSLVIRPGLRLLKRDILAFDDGLTNQRATRRINTAWPIASLAYLPSKKFSVRADLHSITNGASYTRITPHTDVGTRWVVRYHPLPSVSIEDSFVIRTRKLETADFRNSIRSNATTVSWAASERFSAFAGFSYDSFLATASVTFVRGTPPLNTTWRDQTVNRVWHAGIFAQPLARFGFSFSGNFVRSTGAGEISGELPNFGPLSWPMGTATPHYDVPRLGRLAVDLQRTYYLEEIVRGNDFQANLLTIRWTRSF